MKTTPLLLAFTLISSPLLAADDSLKTPQTADEIINQLKPAEQPSGVRMRGLGTGFRGVTVEMPKKQEATPEPQPVSPPQTVKATPEVTPTPVPVPAPTPAPISAPVEKPVTPPQTVVQETQPAPTLNMKVTFEFNSAKLTKEAQKTLQLLGTALQHESLKPYRFQIAGHTDAAGSETYNQRLSEKRAKSVGRELSQKYGVDLARITIVGYGETKLLYPRAPRHSDNRRVQVTNLGPVN